MLNILNIPLQKKNIILRTLHYLPLEIKSIVVINAFAQWVVTKSLYASRPGKKNIYIFILIQISTIRLSIQIGIRLFDNIVDMVKDVSN